MTYKLSESVYESSSTTVAPLLGRQETVLAGPLLLATNMFLNSLPKVREPFALREPGWNGLRGRYLERVDKIGGNESLRWSGGCWCIAVEYPRGKRRSGPVPNPFGLDSVSLHPPFESLPGDEVEACSKMAHGCVCIASHAERRCSRIRPSLS